MHLAVAHVLDAQQIQRLFVDVPYKTLAHRLRQLYDHGYIDRLSRQPTHLFDAERGRCLGSSRLVYGLDNKGARALTEIVVDSTLRPTRWDRRNRIGVLQIEHSLMRSEIYVTLREALLSRTDVRLVNWRQGKELWQTFHDQGKRHVVYPDALFSLEFSSPRQRVLHCLLEADRTTMTHKRFLEKLVSYWRFNRTGRHRVEFGVDAFLVLTVTRSRARRDNLCGLSKQADDRQKGSRLFRFACQDDLSPDTILSSSWHTPRDRQPVTLLT